MFQFDPGAHMSPGTHYFSSTSDAFFSHLTALSRRNESLTITENEERTPNCFDIIFIDGLHTFEQALRDFENSLRFSHQHTIWIMDDTVPCDMFSAIPDIRLSYQKRREAGIDGKPWHGDVFKAVFAIHDTYPDISYCTIMDNGNPQTILWRTEEEGVRTRIFDSLERINALSYFDMVANAFLLLPIKEADLMRFFGKTLCPLDYADTVKPQWVLYAGASPVSYYNLQKQLEAMQQRLLVKGLQQLNTLAKKSYARSMAEEEWSSETETGSREPAPKGND